MQFVWSRATNLKLAFIFVVCVNSPLYVSRCVLYYLPTLWCICDTVFLSGQQLNYSSPVHLFQVAIERCHFTQCFKNIVHSHLSLPLKSLQSISQTHCGQFRQESINQPACLWRCQTCAECVPAGTCIHCVTLRHVEVIHFDWTYNNKVDCHV